MSGNVDPQPDTADREIVLARTFEAPRELVFAVFTDARHLASWWGPRGFTTTTLEMDVRPGGLWRFVMHGPDGVDYPNRIAYREVVAPERLVYHHSDDAGDDPIAFDVTVTFEERGGKTTVTMRSVFPTAEDRRRVVEVYGAIEGGRQTLDRLGERLGDVQGQRTFTIARTFDAPRDLVWRAWTEPERLARWWGPAGCEVHISALDLRPDGRFHYRMRMGDGPEFWGRFVYREVAPPVRLTFVLSFADADCQPTRAPWDGQWPLLTLTTVVFEEQSGRTTITLTGRPLDATAEEHAHYLAGFDSMTMGFGSTFDQLAAYLVAE